MKKEKNNIYEMPIGFANSLNMDEDAASYFHSLATSEKEQIKEYIQNSSSGIEAKEKISDAIAHLSNQSTEFLS